MVKAIDEIFMVFSYEYNFSFQICLPVFGDNIPLERGGLLDGGVERAPATQSGAG
jgi:hypothetical protein